jgi:hypothetical protein
MVSCRYQTLTLVTLDSTSIRSVDATKFVIDIMLLFFCCWVCEAEFFRLPYLKPYLGFINGGDIKHGVNFAVAGASALDRSFFEEKGFDIEETANYSLMVQLDGFKELLPSICNSTSSEVT